MCEDKKVCKKCGVEKDRIEFSNHKGYKDGKRSVCKDCYKEERKKYNGRYKERVSQWYYNNMEITKERAKQWKENNKDRNKELNRKSDKKRRHLITKKNREKYHSNDLIRVRYLIHCLIGNSFRKKGYGKNTKTQDILGISFIDFKNYLEKQFLEGMTWENKNYWEVDHIIPISIARNVDEIIKLNHHTNLRPLWKTENRKKSDKILEEHKWLMYKLLGGDFVLE